MATPFDGPVNDLIEDIQDIAKELLEFQPYLIREAAPDVPALVSELFAVSACLRDLQIEIKHSAYSFILRSYSDPIRDFLTALSRTLRDLERYLEEKEILRRSSRREAYLLIWGTLNEFFLDQGGDTLLERIGCFKLFLQELNPILAGRRQTREFDYLYEKIEDLLSLQDSYVDRFRQPRLDPAAPPVKVRSWERKRPGPLGGVPQIVPPVSPAAGRAYLSSPISPPGMGRFWDFPVDPLRPPSPTLSSTFTATSSAVTPPSSAGSEMENHWLRVAFAQSRPNTNFDETSTGSKLFDEHMQGVGAQLRKKEYLELLVLPFDSCLDVRIYVREKDYKTRIHCKHEKNGNRIIACRPITSLYIYRKESNLQICRMDKKKKPVLWVDLRFPSYERLILFFCAFLALKSSDLSTSGHKLDDHVLKGEIHVFSCTIVDDHYRHALQIYKDTSSLGIRLQASVLKGKMKKTPVWTAFINYKISSMKWMKRVEPTKIHLGDLPRYVFLFDYTPHLGSNGEHELHFENQKDADRFETVIEDLAEGRL